ncbi:hypothetical protein ACOMHN_046499 [Nucella lapillus]
MATGGVALSEQNLDSRITCCGAAQATVTCPTCRAIHVLNPAGAKDLQDNFYIDSDPASSVNQPDIAMATQDRDPSHDLWVKVEEQVKVLEVVTSRLAEEEKEIERQKKVAELEVRQHYEAVIHRPPPPGSKPQHPALLSDTVFRHFRQQAASPQHIPKPPLFVFSRSANMADLTHSLRDFMGTVAPSGGGKIELAGKKAGESILDGDQGCGLERGDGGELLVNQEKKLKGLETAMQREIE